MNRRVIASAAAVATSLLAVGCAPSEPTAPTAADKLWETIPEELRDCPAEFLTVDAYGGSFACWEPGHERSIFDLGHPESTRETRKAYCEIAAEQGELVGDACAEFGLLPPTALPSADEPHVVCDEDSPPHTCNSRLPDEEPLPPFGVPNGKTSAECLDPQVPGKKLCILVYPDTKEQ